MRPVMEQPLSEKVVARRLLKIGFKRDGLPFRTLYTQKGVTASDMDAVSRARKAMGKDNLNELISAIPHTPAYPKIKERRPDVSGKPIIFFLARLHRSFGEMINNPRLKDNGYYIKLNGFSSADRPFSMCLTIYSKHETESQYAIKYNFDIRFDKKRLSIDLGNGQGGQLAKQFESRLGRPLNFIIEEFKLAFIGKTSVRAVNPKSHWAYRVGKGLREEFVANSMAARGKLTTQQEEAYRNPASHKGSQELKEARQLVKQEMQEIERRATTAHIAAFKRAKFVKKRKEKRKRFWSLRIK